MPAERSASSAVMSDDESTRSGVTMDTFDSESECELERLFYEAEEKMLTDGYEDAQARQRLSMTCRGLVHREVPTPAMLEDMFGGFTMRIMGLAQYVLRR